MPTSPRWMVAAELACLALLCVWVAALPLPFGSVIPEARTFLVATPLAIGCAAALVRLLATRDRTNIAQPTRPWLILGVGGLLFFGVMLLQLVPLSAPLLRAISPESYALWHEASRVAALAGVESRRFFPLTVDPSATSFELVRIASLLAAFTAAALLIRNHARRTALAVTISLAALFETLYGVREAAIGRYAIWGWVNKLIFHRVTGTFVNPNHFGHYLAIALPLALFIGAVTWHYAGSARSNLQGRLLHIAERGWLPAAFSLAAVLACAVGVLLAQSRGALLSLAAGVLAIAAFLPGKRAMRVALAASAGLVLVVALVLFLGPERTVARFIPTELERQSLVGRKVGIAAALGLWQRFPIFGSGLGTFERVVFMEQRLDVERFYHHAHNDYAELAATAGTLGFTIALVALFGGYHALVRMTFGDHARELTWRRRAFQAAALASLTVAMVHALFDFNFFIPANPATLAVIVGAAVAAVDHDKRTRR